MSLFVFGCFTMLIAGSSMAVYYKRNEAFGIRPSGEGWCSVTRLTFKLKALFAFQILK